MVGAQEDLTADVKYQRRRRRRAGSGRTGHHSFVDCLVPPPVVAIFALSAVVRAQTPGVPHGGGACVTDEDCSLGGVCNSASACVCDAWFTGSSCALLNLQAPHDEEHGTCGKSFTSYHSWGGRTIFDDADAKWHAVISFMCNHKTLDSWTTASASAHFISDTADGVYTWGPEQCTADGVICTPSIIPWSHNTVLLDDGVMSSDTRYQVWHVGDGIAPASEWAPCYNASQVGAAFSATSSSAVSSRSDGPNPGNTAYVATAPTPSGPWTRALENAGVPINFTNSWTRALAGNPAPLLMPDGSYNLYFTAVPCPPNSGAKASNCIALATSTSGFAGPYELGGASHPITYPESEDPSVFRDPRGNYHLLTNVNTCHARCAQGIECGGHAWSRDGRVFSNLTIGAYGPAITFANGSVWRNAYVERPLVTLDADGKPLAFYVGMARTSYADSCNWPQLFCTGAPGEQCGPTTTPPPPPPPPPSLVKNGGQCLTFNASHFPCSGAGPAAGCPLVLGPCDGSAGTQWRIPQDGAAGTITSAAIDGIAVDVDCNLARPHQLVKVLASGAGVFSVNAAAATIQFGSSGMCLNGGQGPATPPCGPKSELWLETQIQLAPCSDVTALGWSVVPAAADLRS